LAWSPAPGLTFTISTIGRGRGGKKIFHPGKNSWHASGRSIRRHVDNFWRLGGRIITDLNETPRLCKQPVRQVLRPAIDDDEGGPLINGGMDE